MRVVVFTGPTLSADEAMLELEANYQPPVAQGDVYRVARQKPAVIGIVDGYFDRVPAVWHKEILWAMSQGIYVFGSASMGALRAAELAPFGMIGVGSVFMDFHTRRLEDDDEVAVIHGPAETGYRCFSDAMVNIRATLLQAVADGIIGDQTAQVVASIAKQLPYYDRTYRHVCALAIERGEPAQSMHSFMDWVPHGAVNRKRLDAMGMLRAIGQLIEANPGPFRPEFRFHHTDAWEAARKRTLQVVHPMMPEVSQIQLGILEELKIAGEYRNLQRSAMGRLLALEQATSMGVEVDKDAVQRQVDKFRIDHHLETREAFTRWLVDQQLEAPDLLYRFFSSDVAIERIGAAYEQDVPEHVIDELRLVGTYPKYRRQAELKRQVLAAKPGLPTLSQLKLTEAALWAWYFANVLGTSVPDDMDAYAIRAGFQDLASLRSAVLGQYVFQTERPQVAPNL